MSDDALEFPLRLGRVARALGLQGELVLQCFRRRHHAAEPRRLEWQRLKQPLDIELEHPDEHLEQLRVTHARWLDPIRVALRVEGLSDRDAAEGRVGAYFDVDPERLAPELCDDVDACFGARALHADSGAPIGSVRAIRDNGAQALLELGLGDGEDDEPTALIPVVPELVVEQGVDAAGRWVRIRPIPGLLEANR